MHFSSYELLFMAFLGGAIGFTMLNYSQDGDLKNRQKKNIEINSKKEAWDKLILLTNANVVEVTWNTTLFVAFVSSLVFLSLLDFHKQNYHPFILWLLSLFTVFALQDTVIRWKNAHRKHPLVAEQLKLIDNLRFPRKN